MPNLMRKLVFFPDLQISPKSADLIRKIATKKEVERKRNIFSCIGNHCEDVRMYVSMITLHWTK